jgi:hypothetical protein
VGGGVTVPAVKPFQSRKLAFEILEDRIVPTAHWYLVAQAPQSNYEGDAVSLTVAADNQDGDPVNLAVSGLPSGLSLTYSDIYGQITGVVAPGASAGSPYDVTVSATDTVTNVTTSETIDWTVNQTIVTVTSPGDQTNVDGQSFGGLQVNASDSASHLVVFSATGLPSGLTIDPNTGIIQTNLANNASLYSPYSTTITATDTVAGVSDSKTFNWTVNPIVALSNPGDQSNFDADTVDLPISASDSSGRSLSFAATGLPSGLSIDGSSGVISGTIASNADASGPYSVTLTATDGVANVSASQTFNWAVSLPTVTLTNPGDQSNFCEDTVDLSVSASDSANHPLNFTAINLPDGLSIASSTGVITGTVADDACNTTPYSVTITAAETSVDVSASQTFSWSVTSQPYDMTYTTVHDTALTDLDLSQCFVGPGLSSINIVSNPSYGTLTLVSGSIYSYQPASAWIGQDTFTLNATTGNNTSNTGTVTINVTDTAPVAQPQVYYVHAGQTLTMDSTGGLQNNASDPDNATLTAQLVGSGPANGTLDLQPDGSFTYTPVTGFVGDDTFFYRLFDGVAYSDTAQVTIHVQDQAPIASPSSFNVWTAQGISAGADNVLAGATDPDGDALTAVLVTGPQYAASFQLNSDGTFSYMPMTNPPANFNGVDSFTIEASDGTMTSAPVTVALDWTTTPVGNNGAYLLGSNGQITVSAANGVLSNDFNPMQVPVTAGLIQGIDPSVGTLNLNGDGSFDFTAGSAFNGVADFTYGLFQNGVQIATTVFPIVQIIAAQVASSTSSLYSVAFNVNSPIAPDNSADPPYTSPQWLAQTGGGDAVMPGHEYPISFNMGTAIGATPIFQVTPASVPFWQACGNNILVRGIGYPANSESIFEWGYNQNFQLQLAGNTLTGFVTMDSQLADETAYYPTLTINWQISPNNGTTWITPSVSTSSNQTFVTLATPVGGAPLLSALYIATEGAGGGNGSTDETTLLASVWSAFTGLNVTSAEGTPLGYYSPWDTNQTSAAGLIVTGDGVCDAWASLFVSVLNAWGYSDICSGDIKTITSTNGTSEAMLINNWEFLRVLNVPQTPEFAQLRAEGFDWYNVPDQAENESTFPVAKEAGHYVWIEPTVVNDQDGVPGQNSPDPMSIFGNHKVVQIGDTLYDPSYGTIYSSLQDFENKAIAGYMVVKTNFTEADIGVDVNGDGVINNQPVGLMFFRRPIQGQLGVMD